MAQPSDDIKRICDVLSSARQVCLLYKKGMCKKGQKCFLVDFFFLTHYVIFTEVLPEEPDDSV